MKTISLCLGLLIAVPAVAQGMASDRADLAQRLSQADADGDGQVTRAEFVAYRAGQFARFDRNGDGFISDDDVPRLLAGRFAPRLQAMRQQFDTNHDGRISRDEFVNGPARGFDLADANHDNIVTAAEMKALNDKSKAIRGG
ncbi:EF-hand domain-containing protein [Novosphingobium humi]|uniref:EF-hand domain-containing protein n=1 Tax=Novosphingobium humi TaxID=2282397 RepID=A0ABY7U3B9_9SPHN|nr:EF-hand domain-containing protein [Novosphingobium humi]WCT78839.1 EF-hand domain-containing protein [Novosphingobium humi]WJS97626.1 EF-hand domain-containing protein [Novosphingobium humi]